MNWRNGQATKLPVILLNAGTTGGGPHHGKLWTRCKEDESLHRNYVQTLQ